MVKALHYDPSLKDRLPANSDNPLVLNRNFGKWNDYLAVDLKERPECSEDRYTRGKERELLKECQDHADYHNRPIHARNVAVLVHPFYLALTEMDQVDSDVKREQAKEYLDNLGILLNSRRDRRSIQTVALETAHHYAAATSLLLEHGLIDRVVFTEYDRGKPLNSTDISDLSGRKIFMAGGYLGRCFRHAYNALNIVLPESNILGIRDLIINSPRDSSTLFNASCWLDGMTDGRIVLLEDFLAQTAKKQVA